MLAEGKPLPIDQLAAETGHEVDRLRELLVSVRSQFDEEGRLVDLFGMTLEPTPHRLEIGTNVVYSCCALWAHVIPKLIGRSISVRSTDPVGGELVSLSVSPVGIEFLEPVGAAATMAVASAQDIAADVSAAFCHHVNHFASGESAEVFAAESDVRSVVTVDQLNDFGSLFYRKIRSGLED
jgi:alkylmercury lyase